MKSSQNVYANFDSLRSILNGQIANIRVEENTENVSNIKEETAAFYENINENYTGFSVNLDAQNRSVSEESNDQGNYSGTNISIVNVDSTENNFTKCFEGIKVQITRLGLREKDISQVYC